MSYTALAMSAVLLVVLADLVVLRTRLVQRKIFWTSYAIILGFQLLTNGLLTGLGVVRYDGRFIVGSDSPERGTPPFVGDGRIAFAPFEDLLFGFSMVLLTLTLWVFWGRLGVQREPTAGPPRFQGSGHRNP